MACAPSHAAVSAYAFDSFMERSGYKNGWKGMEKYEKDTMKDEAVSKKLAQAGKV